MTNYDRAHKLAFDLASDLKYLYWDGVVGIIGIVCCKHNLPLSQDTIDGCKAGIREAMFDGIDIEFDDYGMWCWWDQMSPEWFAIKPGQLYNGIQYAGDIKCNKKPSDFKE